MDSNRQKDMAFLVVAGIVFALLNGGVWVAAGSGRLAPIDNPVLWGAFVVLNVCSLLWAVRLLGFQPIVVAVSYVAGGALAFMGVRMLPDVNIAEITTAGATYGAFGALAVGNATTRVRLAFFNKGQIPFIVVVATLLLLDGFLNSQVSKAGAGVVLNALVFPFIFSGVVVGLVWMVIVRLGVGKNVLQPEMISESEPKDTEALEKQPRLVIEVPERDEEAQGAREAILAKKDAEAKVLAARKAEENLRLAEERVVAEEIAAAEEVAKEESKNFFPLEIDKGEEPVVQERSNFEENDDEDVVQESILDIEKKTDASESSGAGDDWLNSHMDLLNELTKKAS